MSMSKSCSVVNIDNSRNVNVLSNNTFKDIQVVVKTGVDVVVKGVPLDDDLFLIGIKKLK